MTTTTIEPIATKVGVTLCVATVPELRDLANRFEARIAADGNDMSARYDLDRVNSELSRRQRLCRAPHPTGPAYAICTLLDGHHGAHRSLTERGTWAR
jgi:hypothetical protein